MLSDYFENQELLRGKKGRWEEERKGGLFSDIIPHAEICYFLEELYMTKGSCCFSLCLFFLFFFLFLSSQIFY